MSDALPEQPERRLLRRGEVERRTGIKRAHIYELMRDGRFPQAVRLGARTVRWDSIEVDQWIADRLSERGKRS